MFSRGEPLGFHNLAKVFRKECSRQTLNKHNVVVVTWNPAGPSSSPKIKTTLDGDRESSPSLLSKNRVEKPESSPSRREIYSVTPSIFAPFPSSGFARSNSRNELSGRDLTARIRCLSCSPPQIAHAATLAPRGHWLCWSCWGSNASGSRWTSSA